MKTLVKFCFIAAALAACAIVARSEGKKERVDLQLIYYAEAKDNRPEWVFVMRGLAYRSLAELRKAVVSLLKGSEIVWDPGCCVIGGEPLRSKEEIADFKAHCERLGMSFRVILSG